MVVGSFLCSLSVVGRMDDDEAAVAAADDDDDVHDYYDDGLHCSFAAFVWYSFSGFLLHIIQSTNSKYELNSQEPLHG